MKEVSPVSFIPGRSGGVLGLSMPLVVYGYGESVTGFHGLSVGVQEKRRVSRCKLILLIL